MNPFALKRNRRRWSALFGGILILYPVHVLAAASGSDWRPVYDVVMMWVNFAILVGVLVKVLRRPLSRYFQERRDEVQHTLDHLETEKARMEAEIQALQQQSADRRRRAAELHTRIVARGEAERHEVMAAARREAARRIEKARQQIDARHREARLKLRDALVDAAVEKALERLPRHMTSEVERLLTRRFLQSLDDAKR